MIQLLIFFLSVRILNCMNAEGKDHIDILEERTRLYLSRVLNFPIVKPELVILDLTHRCN